MELQGKVIAVLPERSGVSARGEWKAQSFVIETHEQYPKKLYNVMIRYIMPVIMVILFLQSTGFLDVLISKIQKFI